jgi:hypothetical protein
MDRKNPDRLRAAATLPLSMKQESKPLKPPVPREQRGMTDCQ